MTNRSTEFQNEFSAKKLLATILKSFGLFAPAKRLFRSTPLARQVFRCRREHARVLRRIRSKPKNEKINVLFLVGEPAKWKCQKLYEAMRASGIFDPVVGLTAWNGQSEMFIPRDEDLDEFHKNAEKFFDALGDNHVRTYALHPRRGLDLTVFSPDLVVYSEPWSPMLNQWPQPVSAFALPFFVPYFIPNFGHIQQESQMQFYRFLYGYFVLNRQWADLYRGASSFLTHSERLLPLGHPALDWYDGTDPASPGKHVIYAPHFSFPFTYPKNRYIRPFSTFDWNGREILDYAKSHPDFNWVFKPHPLLRGYLVESGTWTKEQTDAYYKDWETLGTASYDGDYQKFFIDSRVLITDSCSFLTEYAATGKPIIHLLRNDNGAVPLPPSKAVYDTYYKVYGLDEMFATFKTVLEDGLDPKRDERLAAARQAQIAGTNASANIVAYLRKLLRR